ncbi:MAG TPA: hypothetical protein PK871_04985, partial [Mycobacterium sp.]|nr:hypothetical protein [Mycobacterium sp.]
MAAANAGPRRRRRTALILAVLAVAAVAGVVIWQERAGSDRLAGPSPTWRADSPSGAPGAAVRAAGSGGR